MSAESVCAVQHPRRETHLSRIIERVERGEEVIISRAGHPVAKVVPLTHKVHRTGWRSLRVTLVATDDWDSAEANEVIARDSASPDEVASRHPCGDRVVGRRPNPVERDQGRTRCRTEEGIHESRCPPPSADVSRWDALDLVDGMHWFASMTAATITRKTTLTCIQPGVNDCRNGGAETLWVGFGRSPGSCLPLMAAD